MEELKVPECVRIANRREHAAEDALLRFHAIFLPEPSNIKMIAGGHHVLEEVASRCHETLNFRSSCPPSLVNNKSLSCPKVQQ